jgi:hypothetical protein
VQAPTKYELLINLKTIQGLPADCLGFTYYAWRNSPLLDRAHPQTAPRRLG